MVSVRSARAVSAEEDEEAAYDTATPYFFGSDPLLFLPGGSDKFLKSTLQKQMNTGIVYGNIVIQFRYFFVFGVFAKQLKAGLAKTLSPALGGDNNIPDLSCTTRLLLFLVRYYCASYYF